MFSTTLQAEVSPVQTFFFLHFYPAVLVNLKLDYCFIASSECTEKSMDNNDDVS